MNMSEMRQAAAFTAENFTSDQIAKSARMYGAQAARIERDGIFGGKGGEMGRATRELGVIYRLALRSKAVQS